MKRFLMFWITMLIALLLVNCSCFDSAPVGPKILGVTHVVHERGLMYVEIDSMRYPVTEVFTGKTHPRVGTDIVIAPVAGMQVTVAEMTGSNSSYQGIMFMLGEWNEAQIEEAFHRNYTLTVIMVGWLLLCFLSLTVYCIIKNERQRKKSVIHHDNIRSNHT